MKYASLNNSHNKCHGNKYYTDRIFLETPVQIDHSIFASYRTHAPICFASWGFLCIRDAGHRGKKSPNTGKLTHAHVRPVSVWQLKLLWIAEEKLGNLVIQTIAPIISNSARTEVSSWTLFCDHSDHKKWKPTFHKIKIIMQNDVHVSFQDKFIQVSLRYTFATGVKTLLVKWFHILLIVIVKRH